MSGVERFEDLIAWQLARELTKEIYSITGKTAFARDFGLRDQIRRAAVSVMSNIAEGFERAGAREFHQFLVVAKASCAEVRSQLYVAFDTGYLDEPNFYELHALTNRTSQVIGALRASINRRQKISNIKETTACP